MAGNNLTASGTSRPTLVVTTPMEVTGIGAGKYLYSGQVGGAGYYNLDGEPNNPDVFSFTWNGGIWYLTNGDGDVINSVTSNAPFPDQATWTGSTVTAGTGSGEIVGAAGCGMVGANPLFPLV